MAFNSLGQYVPQQVAATPQYLQWGNSSVNQQSMIPTLNQQGLAPSMSYENGDMNVANQQVLAQQGGLTQDALLAQQPQVGGMQTGDMLNFGLAAASTLGGMYFQKQSLDQSSDSLALATRQYDDLRADKAELAAVNQARNTTSLEQQAANKAAAK